MATPSPAVSGGSRVRELLPRRLSWELVLALGVQLAMLLPILRTPFINDDQFNSNFVGLLHHLDQSYWTYVHNQIDGWITVNGRFFPVSTYIGYAGWYVIHGLLLYKWALIVSSLLACASVWWFLREIRVGRGVAALMVVGIAAATQYRYYYDPHFSFNALTQAVMILLSLSLICFQRWLTRGAWGWLAGSMVLAALAASTYEAVYLFAPLFIFLAMRERRGLRAVAVASVGPVVLMVVFLGLASYLRSKAIAGEGGDYAPSYDLQELGYTFVDQFLGGIPLTYAAFDPSKLYTGSAIIAGTRNDWLVGAVTFGVVALLIWRSRWGRWSPLQTGALGLALWLIVAATSALARRYQAELVAGLANVPVYFQEIAFGIVVVSAVGLAVQAIPERRRPSWGRPALAVAAAALAAVLVTSQHNANRAVVNVTQPLREARVLEDKALEAGLLAALPGDDAQLYLANYLPYRDPGYYWMKADRDVDVRLLQLVGNDPATPPPSATCALEGPTGSAVLQVDQLPTHTKSGFAAVGCTRPTSRSRVYLYDPIPSMWLTGSRFDGTQFLEPYDELLVRDGDFWRPRDPSAVDVRTLRATPQPGGALIPPDVPGCFGDEGGFRWCGRTARIAILGGAPGGTAVVRFTIGDVEDEDARLTVTSGGDTQDVPSRIHSRVVQRVRLDDAGAATVRLRYDGPRYVAPGDDRTLFVRLDGLTVGPR